MRALASRAAVVPVVSIFSVLALGCDWRDFNTIQAHTPVLALSAPSHFPVANDFGRFVLPLSGPPSDSTGGSFVVSAAGAAALALVNIDANGQAHGQTVDAPVLDPGAGNVSFPVTSMAEVPGANQVLLGVPDTNSGSGGVYLMTLASTPTIAAFASPPSETRFGLGVAAAKLAGADAPELIVAADGDLTVYLDGDATMGVPALANATCPLQLTGSASGQPPQNRPVLVAPLMAPGTSEIVVGTPGAAGGSVSVFAVDATSGVATCAFSYMNPSAGFGQALATGDFNADGKPDLLIGAPPGGAFWIAGPLGSTSPVVAVTLTGGGGALGASVAAAHIGTVAGDEALIGDPTATVTGHAGAGVVHVVGGAGLDTEQEILQRLDPSGNEAFGVEVHALPFCSSGCGTAAAVVQSLAVVGSDAHVFTFFQPAPGVIPGAM